MKTQQHFISNGDGWRLSMHQTWDDARRVPGRNPVLIVPGYGMNSYIFGYHPNGLSLEGFLVDAGFEVWRVDLRGQGESTSTGGSDNYSIADLALTDLTAAINATIQHTRTGAERVDVIGASLGGTILFTHLVAYPRPRVGSIVCMGSPVRWVKIHPAIRLAFSSPMLAGLIRVRGTRRMAEVLLPQIVRHAPWLLSVYLNPAITDTSAAREMVKTVEDPNRHINRELAAWIGSKDLFVRGRNISEGLKDLRNPLLCVLASHDGIVPRDTAIFPYQHIGSSVKSLLEVGDETVAMAHADVFICNEAHERVFRPLATWLADQNESQAKSA